MSCPDRTVFLRRLRLPLILACLLAWIGPAWAGDSYWIDVRSESEFAEGHVSLAVNIPYEEITRRIDEVTSDKDARIYLYCRSGRRAGIALDALEQAGYTNVVNLRTLEAAQQTATRLETCEQDATADC